MPTPNPTTRPFVRERATGPYWYGKWSRNGKPVVRALGRAWVESDGGGGWRRRRGRPSEDCLTEAQAAARMLVLVREHDADQTLLERDAEERLRRGVTFREVAVAYLEWLEAVKGAKPSTLRDHRSVLGEPGRPHRRGTGLSQGPVMAALGDRPAREISTREIEVLLTSIAATRVAPRTVNKARALICSVFNYGMRPSAFWLAANPARFADRRAEPQRAMLAFYSPEQVEALARSLATGAHRERSAREMSAEEVAARAEEDAQGSELIRVAAYAGLRRGELVALRWRDVDFAGRKLIVRRAVSGDVEVSSTKSRRARQVPLPDQAAAALDRLSRRDEFSSADDYVFANRLGRRLDTSALRRRFERARDAAGLEPLRFHDLRHTYGSLLVAGGVDLASVKAAMGHSQITTTERYLHARPAGELADRFTAALGRARDPARGAGRRSVSEDWPPTVRDPDGRLVVFDAGSHMHLVRRLRGALLDRVDEILSAVRSPDFREDDPVAGRERFYRADFTAAGRWLRVVVDFNEDPGWVVTAFAEDQDPRVRRR